MYECLLYTFTCLSATGLGVWNDGPHISRSETDHWCRPKYWFLDLYWMVARVSHSRRYGVVLLYICCISYLGLDIGTHC